MEHFEQHIDTTLRAARSVSLSREEREEMKRALRLHIADHPAREISRWGFVYTRHFSMQPIMAALVLVLVAGSGASYAAQSALPGDTLYPMKVSFNEPIAGALSVSTVEKAQWDATLAARRLEEAETLATEGRLSDVARAQIVSQFSDHAANFDTAVAALEQTPDSIAVADVQSNLEASLNAHAGVLSDLSSSSTIDGGVKTILTKVRERANTISKAREATDAKISSEVGTTIQKAATEKQKIAEKKLTRGKSNAKFVAKSSKTKTAAPVATMMMAARVEVASVATTTITDQADDTTQAFQSGQEHFGEGKYGEAFTNFQAVIRAAQESKVKNDIRARLKLGNVSETDSGDQQDIHTESGD